MPSIGSTAVRDEITPLLILNSLSSKRQIYVKKKNFYVIAKEWTIISPFVFYEVQNHIPIVEEKKFGTSS